MKKETGIGKWFRRLSAYNYINPDDGTEKAFGRGSSSADGKKQKQKDGELVDFEAAERGKDPQRRR